MNAKITIVTTSPLASNPRVVKEAKALLDAGYRVQVVCGDAECVRHIDASPNCPVAKISQKVVARSRWEYLRSAMLEKLASRVYSRTRMLPERALTRLYGQFVARAIETPGDLYIAHNLTALPVAAKAAKRHGVPLGFDAEDYHFGQFETAETSWRKQLTQEMERRYIPQCSYLTAASDGIAAAYSRDLGIDLPLTLLNVFPLSETKICLSSEESAEEKLDKGRSLYWFSQTIGPDRGLETAVEALVHLPTDVVLSLRGKWADGYRDQLFALAQQRGVANRIRSLERVLPEQMIARAACHDVGLALETTHTINRNICVTNKLFTFLSGGVPTILSDTAGQRPFAEELRLATRLVPQNNPQRMAQAIQELLSDHTSAVHEAVQVTQSKYNWDHESVKLVDYVASHLNSRNSQRAN